LLAPGGRRSAARGPLVRGRRARRLVQGGGGGVEAAGEALHPREMGAGAFSGPDPAPDRQARDAARLNRLARPRQRDGAVVAKALTRPGQARLIAVCARMRPVSETITTSAAAPAAVQPN